MHISISQVASMTRATALRISMRTSKGRLSSPSRPCHARSGQELSDAPSVFGAALCSRCRQG